MRLNASVEYGSGSRMTLRSLPCGPGDVRRQDLGDALGLLQRSGHGADVGARRDDHVGRGARAGRERLGQQLLALERLDLVAVGVGLRESGVDREQAERADDEQRRRCRSRCAAGPRAMPLAHAAPRRRASRRRPRRRSAGCRCRGRTSAAARRRRRPQITSSAGRRVSIVTIATAMPSAPIGPSPAVPSTRAIVRQSRRADHRRAGRDDRRTGGPQRERHRLVLVLVLAQLLAVARHQQQRIVGARAEHEDREDRGRLAVDSDADLGEPVADRARRDLGEHDGEERDPEEDRAAVDHDQQEDHQRQRRGQQRAVDALEDLDRVGREARGAGDLDLQPAAGVAHAVADVVDRVEDRVAVAVARDVADQQRGVPGLREARRGERRDGPVDVALVLLDRLVELLAVAGDPCAVGGGEPALAPVDDHDRRLLAALQVVRDREDLGRLGVTGEERRRLVVLGVAVLPRQVGRRRREQHHEADREDDVLRGPAGRDGEEAGQGELLRGRGDACGFLSRYRVRSYGGGP